MIAYVTVALVVLIILGVALGFAFGIATFLYYLLEGGNVGQLASVAFRTLDSFTFLAIPFFLLAGAIMLNGGLSRRLVDFVAVFTGWVKGGMAVTLVGASTLLGAISGSSVAAVSAVGRIMTEGMVSRGYSRKFVAGLTASSGVIGTLIPPSIPLIVYGTTAGVSIGDMFLAGITSGLLMAVLLAISVVLWARRRTDLNDKSDLLAPEDRSISPIQQRKRFSIMKLGARRFGSAIPALLIPVIILGGIYSGLFTATESGALACGYALLIGVFVYRELRPSQLGKTFLDGILATAPILFIIAMGGVFSRALLLSGVPQNMAAAIGDLELPAWVIIILLNLVMLAVGMFVEENTAIVILVPLLAPLAEELGLSLVQFGVVMVVNLGIGLITPPFAPNLFVAAGASKVPFHQIIGTALRFSALSALPTLIIVNIFPGFSTWFM